MGLSLTLSQAPVPLLLLRHTFVKMVPQPLWFHPLLPLGTLSGGNINHFLSTYWVRHKPSFPELAVLQEPRLPSALRA